MYVYVFCHTVMICIHKLHCNNHILRADSNYYAKNPCFAYRPELSADIVSFSGKEKDLLAMSKKDVFAKIDEAIADKNNFLGDGNEANVYMIPQTPYCVRIMRKQPDRTSLVNYKKTFSLKLNEQDKINHIVAKLGDGSCIMRFIKGENCFSAKNPKELFNLPVEAYRNLYRQVRYAKDNGMVFDCCPTNIIYNKKDKSLTAIDFYEQDKEFPEDIRSLPAIFSSIAMSKREYEPELYKNLLGKLIYVCLDEIESGIEVPQDVSDLDINPLFRKFESYYNEPLSPQYDMLKAKLVDVQCLKIKELMGQDVKKELDGSIKVVRSLVKQLLLRDDDSFLSKLKVLEVFY